MERPRGKKTWIEISEIALTNNVGSLRSLLPPETTFCAVLKANAYGHDLASMAMLCARQRIAHIAVDWIDEARAVQTIMRDATIFILGMTPDDRLADVVEGGFIQTVYDVETLHLLALEASKQGKKALVSLKVETGLHRQGLAPRALEVLLDECARLAETVVIVGVGAHFANAEEPAHPWNARQIAAFENALASVRGRGHDPRYVHIACSAAAMTNPASRFSMVRFGIALYGLWSSSELRRSVILGKHPVELQPVLSWRTAIAQIKDVPSGSPIGYGGTHVTNRPIRVAVIPVGYYDGLDRRLSNRGEVIVRGRKCPILGIVCMNMCMIDISAVPHASRGDTVTLIGRDGMHGITADDIAGTIGTINYEVVTRINPLLPRVLC